MVDQVSIIDNDRDRRPIGIICEHGLVDRCFKLKRSLPSVKVRDCMDALPLVANEDMGAEHCQMLMTQNKLKQLPVVDEEGRYVGEIRLEDLPSDN